MNNQFSKFELFGAGISIALMALALYLIRVETTLIAPEESAQQAAVAESGIVIVGSGENTTQERANALASAADANGNLQTMVIDDIKIGEGSEVKKGDVVSVHYQGTLQNGQEFDNSRKRGAPFEFKVGSGQVIAGWEEGVLGMKAGGQRVLVIPPEKAYGTEGIGPIPPNATLVFAIELLEIK